MATKKARILVACVPQAYTRLFAILTGHQLSFANTLSDAQAALKGDGFDMIMVGVNFDESKMFDLLRYVRADQRYDRAPVVCFRGIGLDNAKTRQFHRPQRPAEALPKSADTTALPPQSPFV